jgi:hypothetical protein
MSKIAWWIPSLVLAGFFFLGAGDALACVGCRTPGEGLGHQERTIQAGLAFSWSVLFLLAVVFAVLGSLVMLIVRTCRAVDARHAVVVRSSAPRRP